MEKKIEETNVNYENPFGLVRPIILYGPYAYYIHAELLWVKDPRSGMCAACVIRIVRTHNLKGLYKPTPIVGQVSVDHQRSFSFNNKNMKAFVSIKSYLLLLKWQLLKNIKKEE